MKTKFENIKTKASEFMKTDKARIGGACVCALLICVGVGFGVNAISTQNSQNLPSKALESTVEKSTKTEGENTEKSSENATENTLEGEDEVTVNDKGEVIDASGNVVAESVEQYNANLPAQSRPVNTSNTATPNNTHQTQPSGSTQPAHTHTWATRCIQEAWDEPIKKWDIVESWTVCNVCGAKNYSYEHMKNHALNEGKSGSHVEERYDWVVTGYTHHDAVYQEYCTTCGATR